MNITNSAMAEPKRLAVQLLQAPPKIIVCDDDNNEGCGPERPVRKPTLGPDGKPVILSVRMTGDDYYIPKNFEEAVHELELMLPENIYDYISLGYGLVENEDDVFNRRIQEYDATIKRDLAYFISEIWNIYNSEQHLLAKQLTCMGNYDRDLYSLFLSLADAPAQRDEGYIIFDMRLAHTLNYRLQYVCMEKLGLK